MFKKYLIKLIGIIFAVAFVMLSLNVQAETIYSLPENSYITMSDINNLNENKNFGKYVSTEISDSYTVGANQEKMGKLLVKLFGILPIREVDVNIVEGKEIYIGGIPLGFSINTNGVIVVGENSVNSESGAKYSAKSIALKTGDIIKSINGIEVVGPEEIQGALENNNGESLNLKIDRKGKMLDCTITPVLDAESNLYKLGLWVRNDASGVGTLTYVDKETNRFGALGHPITDYETGVEVPVQDGKVYNCSMVGIKKGKKGEPGELRCLFMQGKNNKGKIDKNTPYGVYGEINNHEGVVDENLIAEVSSRINVRTGRAVIVSSVSGVREEYEIEIIKANYQPTSSDKSIIFRVKDKRLIDLTGGIVQGMSGSPIMQDGKLVGAVTHVFVSDPTKGYGVYADWMLQQ